MAGTASGDRAVVKVGPLGAERDGPRRSGRVGRDGEVEDDDAIGIDEAESVRRVMTAETEGDFVARLQRALPDDRRNRNRGAARDDVEVVPVAGGVTIATPVSSAAGM